MTAESTIQINLDDMRADPRFSQLDGRGTVVVVIDTGADLDHPFFGPDADGNGIADRIVYQYDFVGANDADASDSNGHGSNVASIVGSQDATYAGMAPGADLIVLRAFSGNSALPSDVKEALAWVASNGAALNIVSVNLSFGTPLSNYNTERDSTYATEAANIAAQGIAIVAAAGNDFQLLN